MNLYYVQSLDKARTEPLNLLMLSGFSITQNIDGRLTLTFTSLKGDNNPGHALLDNRAIINVDGYEFRVEQYSDTAYTKSINAISVLFDHKKTQIEGIFKGSHTLLNHLDYVLKGTGWTCDIDITIASKINYIEDLGNDNVIAALEKIKKFHRVEYLILPDKHLYVAREIGPDSDFVYRYKHNISDVVIKKDTTNLFTVVKGYGADDLAVEYVSPNVEIFGMLEAEPIRDERFTNRESLLNHISTSIQDEPEILIESKVPTLTERQVGERLWLNYEPLGINIKVRIIEQTKILIGENLVSSGVVFGNAIFKTSIDAVIEQRLRIKETTKELYLAREEYRKRFEEERDETNQLIQIAANGKNAIYRSVEEPVGELKDGDLWYKPLGNGETQVYQYDGTMWQPIFDTSDLTVIEQEVNKAKEDAQSAIEAVATAEQNASDALARADSALTNAQVSFDKAQEALTRNDSTIARLTNTEGNVTALQLSATGLANRVSNTEGNLSTLTQTVSGLQTAVTQKVDTSTYNSYVTQTAQALNSKLSSTDAANTYATQSSLTQTSNALISRIEGIKIGGRNLLKNSRGDSLNGWTPWSSATMSLFNFNNQTWIRTNRNGSTGSRVGVNTPTFNLKSNVTYTVSFTIRNYSYSGYALDYLFLRKRNPDNTISAVKSLPSVNMASPEFVGNIDGNGLRVFFTFSHTEDITDACLLLALNGQSETAGFLIREVQIEESNKPSDWSPSPDDISSQIAQLQDNINLRVTKNDIVNQINISTEGILIDGRKIRITGQTVIDDAAISSAKIASLDAGKITTGVLNAANVTVINLNASNITTGVLNVSRLGGGEISGNTIKTSNSSNYLHMQNQVLKFFNSSLEKMSIGFTDENGVMNAEPYIVMGAGNSYGHDKVFINKYTNNFRLSYLQLNGYEAGLKFVYNTGNASLLTRDTLYLGGTRVTLENNTLAAGISELYVDANGRFYLRDNKSLNGAAAYRDLYAGTIYSNGTAVTSKRESKKNIEDKVAAFSGKTVLEEIVSTKVHEYHLKKDLDTELKRIGLIVDEAPSDIIDLRGEGIDLYAMTSFTWKGIQELHDEVQRLRNQIANLEQRIA